MNGATDIRLNVTMDASQARAEAERLHRELTRRYRTPTPADERNRAIDRDTGMPQNPVNPDLPYEHVRHSGIWWANQRGIKGLGNGEYRHQMFTEREAKYMGLQFAKQANKELVRGAKSFGFTLLGVLANEGISTAVNYLSVPGRNNRRAQTVGAYGSGIAGGALAGAGAGAALGSIVPGIGTGIGALAGGIIGGIGGVFNGINAQIGFRNEDEATRIAIRSDTMMRQRSRMFNASDWVMQYQMSLIPSRSGKLEALSAQLRDIQSGEGSETISKLEAERTAMVEGGEYNGHQYRKGDWQNTERGRQLDAILNSLYQRRESISMQYIQTKYSMPHAGVMEAPTDDYSRRGLYVGGQVNVQAVNTAIVDNMKRIIGILESIRKNNTSARDVANVGALVGTW